jgi:hypothetical protein
LEGFVESVLGKFWVQREEGVGPNLNSDLCCWRENRCVAIGSWWIDFLMRYEMKRISFIRKALQRKSRSPLKSIYWLGTSTLPPVGAYEPTTLDRRTCADITVDAAPVTAIISSTIVTGGAIITIGSVIGVPIVVSVVIFVGRPGTQETPYCRVLLS